MSDRNYWVFCDDNCKFPAMTKEQIISAIAEATGKTPTSVDDAFVTKIREMNASANLKFWVGTTYQFSALETKEENTLYILTDDDTSESIEQISEQISAIEQNLSKIIDGTIEVKKAESATNALSATNASRVYIATSYKSILDAVYPVGSIYMSVNSTNPSILFGGTWEYWGAGRVPVAVDSDDPDFSEAEKTGGEKTHTLLAYEIPPHTHTVQTADTATSGSNINGYIRVNTEPYYNLFEKETSTVGSGQAHNNLQPFITCYMWKRTA